MASSRLSPAIPEFKYHNPTISIHAGRPSVKKDQSKAPDLILLFTWTDAESKHTTRYLSSIVALYPSTSIILINTTFYDIALRSTSSLRRRYNPALAKIMDTISTFTNRSPQIITYGFSNGGAFALVRLAQFYRTLTGTSLPIQALILDSGPGIGNYSDNLSSIITPFLHGNRLRYYALFLLFNLLFLTLWLRDWLTLGKSIGEWTYDALNEPDLLPRGVPRMYLYSKADPIVDWVEVEQHAGIAQTNPDISGKVELVRFEYSVAHVAHVLGNEDRYWDSVTRFIGQSAQWDRR